MQITSKIYVAGHRGLVGSAIVRCLRAKGYHNVLTRTHTELDLEGEQAVDAFFAKERPEYVFLAAAKVGGILANSTYPVDFLLKNLRIQNNVIDAAFSHGAKGLLFLGSSCIYPKYAPQPLKEEYLLSGPLNPTNEPYAIAKIAGIKLCEAYNRQYGTRFMSVMPTNLYGPEDNYDLETSHVLPALIRKFHLAKLASRGHFEATEKDEAVYGKIPADLSASLAAIARERGFKIPPALAAGIEAFPGAKPAVVLWGTGTPRREFLYADDLADACVFLIEHYDAEEIINIGTGEDLTIRELAQLAAEVVGYEGDILFDAAKLDGTPQKLLDVSRIKSLGWRPRIGLRQGIQMTCECYLEAMAGA